MAHNYGNNILNGHSYANQRTHNNILFTQAHTSPASSAYIPNNNVHLEIGRSLPHNIPRRSILLNDVMRELQQHVESVLTGSAPTELLIPASNHNQPSESVIINLENVVGNRSNTQDTTNPATSSRLNFQGTNSFNNEGNSGSVNNNTNNNNNNNVNDEPTTDTFRTVIEAQQSLQILQKYLPFLLILIAKGLYDHCEGIFNLIILFATFMHANSVVKREATKQGRRSLTKLFMALLYILACFAFIVYVFEDERLYLNLLFIPPYKQPLTVWDLLWACGLTDFILKLITITFKIFLTMLSIQIIPFQKRGKVYLFIEAVSQLYRSLATIQPWLYYLLESYQGAEKIVGVFLSAAYMVSKGTDLMCRLKLFKTAVLKLLQNVTLGSLPSKDQIQTAGNNCPICHDEYESPVLLQCRHIFCESCVTTWFDREQTCPLCRAKIVDDPSWRDGSTTFFIQLF